MNRKNTRDNMEAARENIRRQYYRSAKQGSMLVILVFLCTQPQPEMYTIASFMLHLVLLYNIITSTMDSFYDSRYQTKFRRQVTNEQVS